MVAVTILLSKYTILYYGKNNNLSGHEYSLLLGDGEQRSVQYNTDIHLRGGIEVPYIVYIHLLSVS